jgi:hypothetical protein
VQNNDSEYRNKITFYGIGTEQKQISKRTCLTEEKPDDSGTRSEASPKKSLSFRSSVWAGKKYSSCWHEVAKITALQNNGRTQPFASRLERKNSTLLVVSGIGIQWASWPQTYVLF